ncbi:MAG: tol-pal system-associated acyl-CoA thioesterase [Pseudomonadota bacterium]|jgi:acyl-CoA thioester hydrolase
MNPIFTFPIRVYWEDTDAGGVVFYANYLKFFERARTEWLRDLGLEQHRLREAYGGIFVVSEVHLQYLRSAKLDDSLIATAELVELGRTSIRMAQEVRLGDVVLCKGTVRAGWVDSKTLKPQRIPSILQDAMVRG